MDESMRPLGVSVSQRTPWTSTWLSVAMDLLEVSFSLQPPYIPKRLKTLLRSLYCYPSLPNVLHDISSVRPRVLANLVGITVYVSRTVTYSLNSSLIPKHDGGVHYCLPKESLSEIRWISEHPLWLGKPLGKPFAFPHHHLSNHHLTDIQYYVC